MVFPVSPPLAVLSPGAIGRGKPIDGKAQVTKEPAGQPDDEVFTSPGPVYPSGPVGPAHPSGPYPGPPAGRREDGPARAAGAEWASLLRSLLPQPVKRRWSREFAAGLQFRGWGIRVAIP